MVTNGDANLRGVEPGTPLRNSPHRRGEEGGRLRRPAGNQDTLRPPRRGYEDRKIRRYLVAQMRAGRIGGFVQPVVKNTNVKRHISQVRPQSGRSTLVVPLDGYHPGGGEGGERQPERP